MTAPSPPRRILIVRPSALGDVCRTVPVLASLRAGFPGARIDWVVRDAFIATIRSHPALTEAIPFPRERFAGWWRRPAVAREMVAWFGDLRRRAYDLVFDCQGLSRSALITRATRAPRRVGFRSARELSWLGCNVRYAVPGDVHTVDEMLALLRAEGVEPIPDMRLHVAESDERWWAETRDAGEAASGRLAVVAPTARWVTKRWPIERWQEVVKTLLDGGYATVAVIGAPDERDQVAPLTRDAASDPRIVDLVGRADIGGTMAVVADADLVIAHDSAPLHMAIGFSRLCVALFGPTDPERVGPYRRPEAVVTGATADEVRSTRYRDGRLGDALMRRISVEQVLERVAAVTGDATPGRVSAGRPAS